ncbi:MAG TPA: hypothetical protein VGK32_23380 [Vicinamibacterales bacterium]|jgi:hypothetical protein
MSLTTACRHRSGRAFPVFVFIAILFLPWPDGGGRFFFRCVATTTLNLATSPLRLLRGFDAFQANLNTPQAGEYVLPGRVRDMLAILRGPGRGVKRYQLSESIAANDWVMQQIVASSWPRTLESGAHARFVLDRDPAMPGCSVMGRQGEVALVYCP